ncbi:FimV/HubP family polar landmark protein [Lysobacter sp. CA196]|uniref:FimV/HubP family polar landmark protein n=1 Tax=Lysobacter sp. CA196 TaxID=3455606 RepID=UPI003F8D43CF
MALALALASGAAGALGLGQIEVKSRAGQPLLAEIPVISSDSNELAQLRAGLASPETFQRIGLQPPQGIVTDLRFVLALDNAGKPVIRVTSTQPVNQPLLTFLIEVDWGQGRLTREYSALLDAPRTVSAPMQPPIQAPTGAAANTIERPLDAPLPFGAQPQASDPLAVENQLDRYDPGSAITAAPPQAAPEPIPVQPIPVQPDPVPQAEPANTGRIPQAPREPRPVAAVPSVGADGDITVERGQTLSAIAAGVAGDNTLNQTMIALLRANPEAFIGGNINRLKQGAVLRLPPGNQLDAIDPREASELVRVQVQQWRQARQPVPQPISLESDAVAKTPVAPAAQSGAASRGNDARLEIVPPGASQATRAGAQSGISAGGEGSMVRQEIQQANEVIAARDAELADLKSRVAELEQLQTQQQKLIAMKDSELATSQQRLAENQARSEGGSPLPWVFGSLGVLALLIGGWVLSRREPRKPSFRAPASATDAPLRGGSRDRTAADAGSGDSASSANSADSADSAGLADSLRRRPDAPAALVDPVAQLIGEPEPAESAEPIAAPFWTAPKTEARSRAKVPTWHAAEVSTAPAPVAGASTPQAGPAPATEFARPGLQEPAQAGVNAQAVTAPGQERIELARAYLDLGDESSARQLLGEVLINGDHAARQQAARLLRELES